MTDKMTLQNLSEVLLSGHTVKIYKLGQTKSILSGDLLMSLEFRGADSLSVIADYVVDAPIVYMHIDDKEYRTLVVYIQIAE